MSVLRPRGPSLALLAHLSMHILRKLLGAAPRGFRLRAWERGASTVAAASRKDRAGQRRERNAPTTPTRTQSGYLTPWAEATCVTSSDWTPARSPLSSRVACRAVRQTVLVLKGDTYTRGAGRYIYPRPGPDRRAGRGRRAARRCGVRPWSRANIKRAPVKRRMSSPLAQREPPVNQHAQGTLVWASTTLGQSP
jgi:hypothetical protein